MSSVCITTHIFVEKSIMVGDIISRKVLWSQAEDAALPLA